MEFIIREAVCEDYEDIRGLNLQLGYDYPPEETKKRLLSILNQPYAKIFAAYIDLKVVGYIHAAGYECAYMDRLINILALVVDGDYRAVGIGRALLSAAEAWAKETGASGVRLSSNIKREGAHGFYTACGYTHIQTHKSFRKTL